MATGGRISTGAGGRGTIDVSIHVDGLDRTTEEFKRFRRNANGRIRDVMVRVGERRLLPDMRSDMGDMIGQRWADSLFVQRERSGVFIGSKQRGPMNRALGWLDFGGQRPLDSGRRTGPKVMLSTLDRHRDGIDEDVLEELLDEFRYLDHTP